MLVLGDSTALGVGVSRLEESLPYLIAQGGGDAHVHNLAVSGATIADVVRDQLPQTPKRAYGDVVLCLSANDATHGTTLEAFAESLRTLLVGIDHLDVEGRVFLTTTPNFRRTPALPYLLNREFERRAERLTASMFRIAGQRKGTIFVDLLREGTLESQDYAADGFHPNAAGYRKWAAVFLAARERVEGVSGPN